MSSVFIIQVGYTGSSGSGDNKSYLLEDCFTTDGAAEERIEAIEDEADRLDALTPPPSMPEGTWLTNRYQKGDTNLYWGTTDPNAVVPTTMKSLDPTRWSGSFSGAWRKERHYYYDVIELNLVGSAINPTVLDLWRGRCAIGTRGCVVKHGISDDHRQCAKVGSADEALGALFEMFDAVRAERDEASALLRRAVDEELPMLSAVYDPIEHVIKEAWYCECGAAAAEVTQDFDDDLINHAPGCLRGHIAAFLGRKNG